VREVPPCRAKAGGSSLEFNTFVSDWSEADASPGIRLSSLRGSYEKAFGWDSDGKRE